MKANIAMPESFRFDVYLFLSKEVPFSHANTVESYEGRSKNIQTFHAPVYLRMLYMSEINSHFIAYKSVSLF